MTRTSVLTIAGMTLGVVLVACQGIQSTPPTSNPAVLRSRISSRWTRTSIGKFADPYGVAVALSCYANCDVYVADAGARVVWRVRPDGYRHTFGNFPAGFDPQGVAVGQDGKVFVADKGNRMVWEVYPDGRTIPAGPQANWPHYPRGVAADQLGDVYTAIPTLTPLLDAGFVYPIQGFSRKSTQKFPNLKHGNPYGVAIAPTGDTIWVADAGGKDVARWYYDTQKPAHWSSEVLGTFVDPYGVAVDPRTSNIFVADAGAKKVWEFSTGSGWTLVGDFADPYGVAMDSQGFLYVADPGSKDVWKLTP